MLKRGVRVLVALAALAVVSVSLAAWQLHRYADRPLLIDGDGVVFEIAPGSSFTAVANALAADGIVTNPTLLRAYARIYGLDARIQAGEYRIDAGTSGAELLQRFTDGDVLLYSFTIIEGWNRWDLLNAIAADPNVETSLSDEDWPGFLAELGAEVPHPEGLFLPETYRFPRGMSYTALLTEAHEALLQILDEEWEGRAADAAVKTPYEALILASIIEKETARADERERISGVFTRRLNLRMRLQTDPTVIYGLMPTFNGDLTRANLRTDTPYNTYTRRGLPPTPIAMAGRAAIYAALHPAEGDELFFVATGFDDGSHVFSVTVEEHNKAVQEYLKRLRAKRRGAGN